MKFLNAQQLAFLLDIKKEDARARMCNAWTKSHGIPKNDIGEVPVARRSKKNKKIEDPFPLAMPIELIAEHLNLPDLQTACDDIENNYLERKATRRWIMWDYPEKAILKFQKECAKMPYKLNLPPALSSMLPDETKQTILKHWETQFGFVTENKKSESLG